jgi:hypothetical protein
LEKIKKWHRSRNRLVHPQEQQQVRTLFNTVLAEGKTYPQDKPLSNEEFTAY